MNFAFIRFDVTAGVATLTFNRPDQFNAMNAAMMREIITALEQIHADPAVRVAVITGAGRGFMGGADLKEYAAQSGPDFDDFTWRGHRLYNLIESMGKPVVAAVNGHALGGGFEIALACDFILARTGAKLGLPEIQLGLIPGGGGMPRLTQKIGVNRAAELVMLGTAVTAEQLTEWGLVNHVYPVESYAAEVAAFAAALAEKEVTALAAMKQLLRLAAPPPSSAALALEAQTLSRLFLSPLGQERIQGFLRASQERKARAAATPST